MSEATEYQRIKDERLKLEQQINLLVTDYEQRTGFRVSDIDLSSRRFAFMAGEFSHLLGVIVTVKI
jgi:hypothetical protein